MENIIVTNQPILIGRRPPDNDFFAKPRFFVILFVSLHLHLLSDTKQYIPKCNGIIVFTDTWVELMRFSFLQWDRSLSKMDDILINQICSTTQGNSLMETKRNRPVSITLRNISIALKIRGLTLLNFTWRFQLST